MIQNIILPKQGLQMTEGFITRWLHKEGDRIQAGEPLFEMETDKLVITIDAAYSGTLLKILYPEGSTVPITTVIAYVGEEGDPVPEAPVPAAPENEAPAAAPAEPRAEQPKAPAKRSERLFATPRAKTAAAEHGVDLRGIVPSGPEGLIIERDVLAHMRGAGKPVSGAAPCILSAQISLFRDEAVSPETVLRLAYRKAAEQTGLSCSAEPCIRIPENGALNFCLLPSPEPQLTLSGGSLTLAFYTEEPKEESVLEFFRLLRLFAEKPWLAAVK